MPVISAGLLMYSRSTGKAEYFLVHPGGPFFAKRDKGSWTIPKGLPEEGEDLLIAAQREFEEETGIKPEGPFIPLDTIKQKGGKVVQAWAFKGNLPANWIIKSNHFELEWPPRSGKKQQFPEMDKGEFFDEPTALEKIIPAQMDFILRLKEKLLV